MIEELGSRSYFQAADYVVCGLMILASLAIGVYFGVKGGGQKTSAAYILADRSMTAVPVTLSLLASLFSGITLQGVPADVYYHGPLIIWSLIPLWLGGFLSLIFFVPLYYRLGMASAYEYLELRFNYAVKICGVMSFLLFTVFYSGVVTYVACIAANAVTGISIPVAIVILCAVCSVYTVIGGMKAVIWTDCLQMILMLTTIFAIIIKCIMELGLGNLWSIAAEGSRTNVIYFTTDLTEFYNGWAFIAQTLYLGIVITNQYMVQRLVACKSEATAKQSLIASILGMTFVKASLVMVGISLYAYYDGCDPSTMGYTTKNDQIVPYFIVDAFTHMPGVPGLLLSGLFGAALSTLSSLLNAMSTLVGEHFVKPYWTGLKDITYTFILKLIVVAASAVACGIAFVVPAIGDAIPVILTFSGCTTGSLVALFLLGAFCPFCGSKGALVGFVVAMVFAIVLSVGCIVYQVHPNNLPLSADVCLNDTYIFSNDTSTTAVNDEMTYWTEMTTLTSGDSDRPAIPVIFSLSKSWLGFVAFLSTIIGASLTTLVTGKNDTLNMDPRLVFWKIKSAYLPSDENKVTSPAGEGCSESIIGQLDDNNEGNGGGDSQPKLDQENEDRQVEIVTAM